MFKIHQNKNFPQSKNKLILAIILVIFLFLPFYLKAETVYNGGDNAEITNIAEEIKTKQKKIEELTAKINTYNDSIKQYRSQSVNLASQIQYLTARIDKAEAEIELTENQISENSLQVQDTENKIKQNESNIEENKKRLREFIQEMYKKDQNSELEIILANDSISGYYNELRSLSILRNKTKESLTELKQLKDNLAVLMTNLEDRKATLKALKDKLEKNKESLLEQQLTKQNILSQTKSSENKFQSLLSQVRAEQASANADVASLEKKLREKLSGGKIDRLKALGDAKFNWPVTNNGVTAYFHDPDYPFKYVFEHPAIDLRAKQGTPIRAAAPGYIGRARDAGKGYSYIMIIHNDGFSTVYGHVSKIYVKEDQFVNQGEIIGLSGGMPGTPGAGGMTTGPHLHFEIRKNGIPVDPLNYLL